MKTIRIHYLFFLLLAVAGCNNMLDLEPKANLSDAVYWKSPGDFRLGANNFYQYLDRQTHLFTRDAQADIYGANNAISQGTNTITSGNDTYNNLYSQIRQVNNLLQRASAYANQDEIKQYTGETYFFRAYLYWKLLRDFGGVVLIDHTPETNDPTLYAARASRDETANFIVADLEKAIALLPLQSAIAASDYGRISKNGAQAFLARVALYHGTYQKYWATGDPTAMLDKAIANATPFVDGTYPDYKLFNFPTMVQPFKVNGKMVNINWSYRFLFTLEDVVANPGLITKDKNQEFIINNRFDYDLRQTRDFITHTVRGTVPKKMVDMYLSNDGLPITDPSSRFLGYADSTTEYANRDPRFYMNTQLVGNRYFSYELSSARKDFSGSKADSANAAPYLVFFGTDKNGYNNLKYSTERFTGGDGYSESADCPIIRLAEVYLIYAEAKLERTGSLTATDLDRTINKLRDRVSSPTYSMAPMTPAQATRTEIRRERTVELFLEGNRFDDLVRWKTGVAELSQPLLGKKITGTAYAGREPYATAAKNVDANGFFIMEAASRRMFTEKNYLLPISPAQIQLNTKLQQNPGW